MINEMLQEQVKKTLGGRAGYSLQVLASPHNPTQAVGFPLLSLPQKTNVADQTTATFGYSTL